LASREGKVYVGNCGIDEGEMLEESRGVEDVFCRVGVKSDNKIAGAVWAMAKDMFGFLHSGPVITTEYELAENFL
jgi:hypothetical protein